MRKQDLQIRRLTVLAMLAALSYVAFAVLQFRIQLPGGDATSIHLGNAVCVLGALLFGGMYGGVGGAVGMSLGDLFDPVYLTYVPKTLIAKLCIGLITGALAHRVFHISEQTDPKRRSLYATLSAVAGLAFNCVFDPLFGYYYKLLILGKPAADLTLAWNVGATCINAVISTAVGVAAYLALRPALQRAGLFRDLLK